MTSFRLLWIACDPHGKEADTEAQFPAPDGYINDYFTLADIRKDAANDGWHYSKGRDICPDCWEAGKR